MINSQSALHLWGICCSSWIPVSVWDLMRFIQEYWNCFLIYFSLLQVGFLTTMAILLHEIPHEVRGLCILPLWGGLHCASLLRGGLGLVNIFLSFWRLLPLGRLTTVKTRSSLKALALLWMTFVTGNLVFKFINCQLLIFLGWRLCNPTSGWLWPLECSQDAAFHSSGGNSRSLLCNMCSVTKRSR